LYTEARSFAIVAEIRNSATELVEQRAANQTLRETLAALVARIPEAETNAGK